MSSKMSHHLLIASLLSFSLAAGLSAMPMPAYAQAAGRAYAPEDLWNLNTADQTRVISLEYSEQSNGRQIPGDQLRFYLDQVRLSRWTFSQVKQDIAKSLGNTGGGWRPPGPDLQTIRCESTDGRTRTCLTPWGGQSRLVRQLSNSACLEGRSWFDSAGRITVTQGCRGEFARASGRRVTVQCESHDGRLRTCGSNLMGRAILVRQLSSARCTENVNFGLRNGSVWVNNGCRGVFEARSSVGGGYPDPTYSVTCASSGGRYTTCAWDARRGMPRLVKRLSDHECRNGYSWGYSQRSGLWVNHGCRARFEAM